MKPVTHCPSVHRAVVITGNRVELDELGHVVHDIRTTALAAWDADVLGICEVIHARNGPAS